MHIEELRAFCLSQKQVSESFPFDNQTLVFKVADKIFVLLALNDWEKGQDRVNLKCDPELAQELREKYPQTVLPGYHMNKKHWNTLLIHTGDLSEKQIKDLILHSYDMVVNKLPKSKRDDLKG
ncbi:MAG: MmcQ/YjbR family DNA-binding protein [Psychroflexus sp.]|nr:MmcQ/YjbR family DNA-binding protein [Psychroflexus sp.]MDN6309035.1 MmcQ/YjbR family DNA-binding protein [Psychroflexus sp.]